MGFFQALTVWFDGYWTVVVWACGALMAFTYVKEVLKRDELAVVFWSLAGGSALLALVAAVQELQRWLLMR